MPHNPADEPPIDTSLAHYMEAQALAIALAKANTAEQSAKIERLLALRLVLMVQRHAFGKEAVAKRHARGEIYSKAQVAAINAMGPTKSDLDTNIQNAYLCQADSEGVLQAHARAHFAYGLVSARIQLAYMPADMADAARDMLNHEEAFAAAWVATLADKRFKSELSQLQRDALRVLRPSTCPMYFITHPAPAVFDDVDAQALGKAWNKLDQMAQQLGAQPLSSFIAIAGEAHPAGPDSPMLMTVCALLAAIQTPGSKFPSKRAAASVLTKIRDALRNLTETEGGAYFEVDL